MKYFDVRSQDELAKLLKVHALEIERVLPQRKSLYRRFTRLKSDGTNRVLYDVKEPLKLLHRKIKDHILDMVPPHPSAHGGVRFRSVATNASPHVGKDVVFSLDIRNFYPTVQPHRVRAIFVGLGFGPNCADLLSDLTTWDGHLPQGFSTSTGLANLAMLRVDVRLHRLAERHGFSYTRWIDDLTLSGNRRLLDFRRLILRIVNEEGFTINPNKTRIMHSHMCQEVTGVVVNEKLNIRRAERRSIRREVLQLRTSATRRESALEKIQGKVSWLTQVNPTLGNKLSRRLARQPTARRRAN